MQKVGNKDLIELLRHSLFISADGLGAGVYPEDQADSLDGFAKYWKIERRSLDEMATLVAKKIAELEQFQLAR